MSGWKTAMQSYASETNKKRLSLIRVSFFCLLLYYLQPFFHYFFALLEKSWSDGYPCKAFFDHCCCDTLHEKRKNVINFGKTKTKKQMLWSPFFTMRSRYVNVNRNERIYAWQWEKLKRNEISTKPTNWPHSFFDTTIAALTFFFSFNF